MAGGAPEARQGEAAPCAELLHETFSVCPICLKQLPAQRVRLGQDVFLRKACPEHGPFQTLLWRGQVDMAQWIGGAEERPLGPSRCPEGCGLCPDHLQGTCCVLLEVTPRCNLGCPFCFAAGGEGPEPPLSQIEAWLLQLVEPGKTLLQLSGGEPTLRDDLPQIITQAKAAGCRYVQLNSNGLRLAEDPSYAQTLAKAGLSFVFLQFDGTEDAIHERLRGRPLLREKQRAIEHCAAANVGVTLVPTLVPGVNTHNIGEILRFAIAQAPAVRGVHFQPVSFFGRMPCLPTDAHRFTLDELLVAIEEQTEGRLQVEQLLPSRCDHPLCGFHGDFLVDPQGRLVSLSGPGRGGSCCDRTAPEKNRDFVGRRWLRPPKLETSCCGGDLRDMGVFLQRVKSHGFTVTAMAFQDAGNLDLERLRRCSLHVFDEGRLVPFCAHYLSAWRP